MKSNPGRRQNPRAGRPGSDRRARNASQEAAPQRASKRRRPRSRATSRSWGWSSAPATGPTCRPGAERAAGRSVERRGDAPSPYAARGRAGAGSSWSSGPTPGQAQASGDRDRPGAARGGRRHDRRRRHDPRHRAAAPKRARSFRKTARRDGRGVTGFERVRDRFEGEQDDMERIVLAYSGGLDTSVAIPWLAEQYGAPKSSPSRWISGRARSSTTCASARSRSARCARTCSTCARSSRATSSCRRCRRARSTRAAIRSRRRSAGRSSRKHLVEIAHIEGATAIAHGCTGKGNDQVRIDVSARALDPDDQRHRSGARLGTHAAGRDRVRAAAQHSRAGDGRQPLQHRQQPLGPLDRVRRARGSLARSRPRRSTSLTQVAARDARTPPAYVEIEFEAACRSRSTASRCRSSS